MWTNRKLHNDSRLWYWYYYFTKRPQYICYATDRAWGLAADALPGQYIVRKIYDKYKIVNNTHAALSSIWSATALSDSDCDIWTSFTSRISSEFLNKHYNLIIYRLRHAYICSWININFFKAHKLYIIFIVLFHTEKCAPPTKETNYHGFLAFLFQDSSGVQLQMFFPYDEKCIQNKQIF